MRSRRSFMPRAGVLAAGLILAGCAGEPQVALGPTVGAVSDDLLREQSSLDGALDRAAPSAGNKVTMLRNGAGALPAMFAALAEARDHIGLEYYIFQNVHVDGASLGDVLVRKLRQGVAVNIIHDSYGSLATDPAFMARLKREGANLLEFHPLGPSGAAFPGNPNDRDHRKIMVIDGRVGFVGVNLDRVYENPPEAGARVGEDTTHEFWRDTAVRVDGPAVADLQRLFMATWAHEKGAPLPERFYFPPLAPAGTRTVRVIGSVPSQDLPLYYRALLRAIHAAHRSIGLSTGYFVPTHQAREELADAARRGVAVRLVLPTASDSPGALAMGRAAYGDLLEAGVRIYEVQDAVLHSKLVEVDGMWSVIGSSNFDRRSVLFNNEVDAVVLGRETADAVDGVLDDDVAHAKEITLAEWRRRSLAERKAEFMARFTAWLL